MILAAAIVAGLLGLPPTAAGQGPADPTLYCQGAGGPLGAATDLEHSVLLGEAPLPSETRSRRISVGGVSTRVVEGGPRRAREAVVFVHGHPGSARDFDALLRTGGKFARTVAFDMPGYGQSDHFARHLQSSEGAASYVGGVLDTLGIRRAVLVLHDFGGPWALQWAARSPERLTAAVLLDSGVFIDYIPHPYAVTWATPGAGEAQMASTTRGNFRSNMQAANPRGLPAEYVDRMYDGYDRATRCAALRYYRSAVHPDAPNVPRRQAAVLRRYRRPALVIWGEKDSFIPPKHAQDQRQAFPDAAIHIFEDSGHWPFIDNADRTRRLFLSFLRPTLSVRRPRARPGTRRLRVSVAVRGKLPAYGVQARVRRRRGSSGPRTVARRRTLVVRLRHPLRPRRYVLRVTARGLKTRRVAFRVRGRRRTRSP